MSLRDDPSSPAFSDGAEHDNVLPKANATQKSADASPGLVTRRPALRGTIYISIPSIYKPNYAQNHAQNHLGKSGFS